MATESRHIVERIDRPMSEVYEYVVNPAHIAEWAPGLGKTITQVDGEWFVDTPAGRARFAFVPRNPFGVLDHDVTMPSGDTFTNPMRVIADGDSSEVVFTVRRLPGLNDDEYARDIGFVTEDLGRLKRIVESL
jgi:hypothetical protein